MDISRHPRSIAFGLLGAALGGCIGYLAFVWLLRQGFYALILPPTLLSLGAGLGSRSRSFVLATMCGVAGLGLALFSEWRVAPFAADQSFWYFITHLHKLRPITLIMLAIGTLFSFRLA